MTRAPIRMMVLAAVLTVVILGCSSAGSAPAPAPTPTITVSGSPSARVTDVAGYSLTQTQLNTLISACNQGAGVPGTDLDCRNDESQIVREPPCLRQSYYCVYAGRIAGTVLGILQLRDQQPDGSTCGTAAAALCAGVVVPIAVVGPLTGTSSASPSPSVTSTPSGTPTPAVSPTTVTSTVPPPSATPSGS
jgi:hypothetical protein